MTSFPSSITAGTTFDRTVIQTAYPAPDWAVVAYLRGPQSIDIESVGAGASHRFTVPATDTALWPTGDYWFSIRASNGTEVVEVDSGQTTIKPDLASLDAGHDGRTHVQKVLDAIEAVLEKRATLDQQRYTINNRELWRTPIPELLMLRDRYRAELRRMKSKGNLFDQHVRVRFR